MGWSPLFFPRRIFSSPVLFVGVKEGPDYGLLAEAVWYVLLGVSRRPRNDPLGAWSVWEVRLGGLASSSELSIGGEGA